LKSKEKIKKFKKKRDFRNKVSFLDLLNLMLKFEIFKGKKIAILYDFLEKCLV